MGTLHETLTPAEELNSQRAIETRLAAGKVSSAGPFIVVALRPALIVLAQVLTAFVLKVRGVASPWHESGHYWTVYATLVDIGCLTAMAYFTRGEGLRLRDLIGKPRWRDIPIGLGYFLLIFPLFLIFGTVFHNLLYAHGRVDPGMYLTQPHYLPLWAVIYSLGVWYIVWSPTEEMTYNAFCLSRMRAVTGRTWITFVVVGFLWAFQHALLPFVVDWRYMAFRTLAFAPGVLTMMAIYWRTRRLTPLIIAHWPVDIAGALMCTSH
jgi:hypothetical protein